jgi:glutamate-5-semialdehyde dehydrogenase
MNAPEASVLRDTILAAKAAGLRLANLSSPQRRALLEALAEAFEEPQMQSAIIAGNRLDLDLARDAEKEGELASALVNRLSIDAKKIATLCDGLRQMSRAPEVVGQQLTNRLLDDNLLLKRITCPLGVLGVVFEARPDALVQITGLALKSGNAVILKGGKEALNTNRALCVVIHKVLAAHNIDVRAVVLIEDRAGVAELLKQNDLVDLMIARGSSQFVHYVRDNTSIPVMAHADGICHVYLHRDADANKAARIAVDAKTSYPAACNTVETLLWDANAPVALDSAINALLAANVQVRGCEATRARHPKIVAATEADWDTEYGELIISVKQVADLDEALAHIARHGSRHTEAIITQDQAAADRFLAEVDAACCFHNASTRFSDGYRFGLGAEVGISTDKLHARGPVGVEGLVTYRWLLSGDGQITTEYGEGKKSYLHKDL